MRKILHLSNESYHLLGPNRYHSLFVICMHLLYSYYIFKARLPWKTVSQRYWLEPPARINKVSLQNYFVHSSSFLFSEGQRRC